jgi:hypothetical protein
VVVFAAKPQRCYKDYEKLVLHGADHGADLSDVDVGGGSTIHVAESAKYLGEMFWGVSCFLAIGKGSFYQKFPGKKEARAAAGQFFVLPVVLGYFFSLGFVLAFLGASSAPPAKKPRDLVEKPTDRPGWLKKTNAKTHRLRSDLRVNVDLPAFHMLTLDILAFLALLARISATEVGFFHHLDGGGLLRGKGRRAGSTAKTRGKHKERKEGPPYIY